MDANHAGVFRAPAGSAEAIVAEVTSFYRAVGAPPAAYVDALATPADLPEALLRAGFNELSVDIGYGKTDLMVYVGPDRERPSSLPVERADTQEGRVAWAAVAREDVTAEQQALLDRLHLAALDDLRVTGYLARADGQPAGRCLLFADDGLGRVESVRTLEAYQRRGAAGAAVRAAVAASLAAGNALTYLYAEQGGAAQRLYERLGFRTVARDVMRCFYLDEP
jgi:ribosomal protein S18 acetylase RimI-like enzyme